jgi:hypothetical protein
VSVFGSVIGDVEQVPNHAVVHYDEALSGQQALGLPAGMLPIDYAHFTRHDTTVDD